MEIPRFNFLVVLKQTKTVNSGFINGIIAARFLKQLESPGSWGIWSVVDNKYITDSELEIYNEINEER